MITIKKNDMIFMRALFNFRALSLKQSYLYYFRERYKDFKTFYSNYIVPLVKAQLVQLQSSTLYGFCVGLTQKSLNLLIKCQMISVDIWDESKNGVSKGITDINDVVISDRLLDHQIAMNDFILRFLKIYEPLKDKIAVYDEKYCSQFNMIRPDALIRIGKYDLFIEQDMGTESLKQLGDKWNRYRRFLTYEFNHKRKIVVCFIVQCKKEDVEKRKNLIRRSIINTFSSLLTDYFEIYIGTKEEMLQILSTKVLKSNKTTVEQLQKSLSKHSFSVYNGRALNVVLEGSVYNYYISRKNDNGGLLRYVKDQKGRYMEFLVDDYRYAPISVLSKIAFHQRNAMDFDLVYSKKRPNMRLIGYIIIVDDLSEIKEHLKVVDLLGTPNVYFTTYDRLNTKSFPNALIWFDQSGIAYCCDSMLCEPIIQTDIH